MNKSAMNKSVLILLVIFISAVFLSMIHQFLMAIFLAGIFTALAQPAYHRLEHLLKGRRAPASLITLLLIVLLVLLPLGALIGIITAQAIKVSQSVTPWVQKKLSEPDALTQLLESIPYHEKIEPYQDLIFTKAGEMVGAVSNYLIENLSSVTMGTVNFLFMALILLYSMFFFLMDGDKLLCKILYYLPLEDKDERLLLRKFTSVTRATLKGTAIIGILQGAMAGIAFAVVGIPSAIFWGAIMAVLSVIPGIGSALIWVPAAIILAAGGHYIKAIGLALFCGLVVGSLDNLLRPRLVGKDTEMHELLILFGTLGGIVMFGIAGIIIGPIVAALFVTVWEIYGMAFQDVLPEVGDLYGSPGNKATETCTADDDQNDVLEEEAEEEKPCNFPPDD
jgi:predicted PurR-regulated permease PerM